MNAASPAAATPPTSPAVPGRLMSIDALRGFDMFWIIGADSLVYALNRMSRNPVTGFFADQLEHAEWQGFHFYDLIFPLFVFMMGASLVFSLTRLMEQGGRAAALRRVVRRGVLLFLVGLFYSGGFSSRWPDMRLMGVLNRIALAYTFGGMLFCTFRPRALAGICVALLVSYWALMSFMPIRDLQLTKTALQERALSLGDTAAAELFQSGDNPSAIKDSPEWAAARKLFYGTTNWVTGKFAKGYNVSDHFDFRYLPGKKYDTFFDPEGILSTIPAVATCLLGIFAGLLLKDPEITSERKLALLIGSGIVLAGAGWLWSLQFPVVKKIWTSSFVLVAGGYSALLLGIFYLVVDIWKARAWCQPFVWMGMNSITIYLTSNIIGGFRKLAGRFVGGDVRVFLDAHLATGFGDLVISLVGLMLAFCFVRFLYQRKIFLRL